MLRLVQDVSDRTRGTGVSLEKNPDTSQHEKREPNFKNQHTNLFHGNEMNNLEQAESR
jgi:hypothetical protein